MENREVDIKNSLELIDRLIYILENLDNTNEAKAIYVDTLAITLLNISRLYTSGWDGDAKADIQKLKNKWGYIVNI